MMTRLDMLMSSDAMRYQDSMLCAIYYEDYDGVFITMEDGEIYEVDSNMCVDIDGVRYFVETEDKRLMPFMRA